MRPSDDLMEEGSAMVFDPDSYFYNDGFGPFLKVKDAFKKYCHIQIKNYIEQKGLNMENPMTNVTDTSRGGNANTLGEYISRYLEMKNFFMIIGD